MGSGAQRLTVLCYELAWSGQFCLGADDQATLETLLWHLELMFHKTGGVPDHLAVRPIRPLAAAGGAGWSAALERFCEHYGCEPQAKERLHLDGMPAPEHGSCGEATTI